MVSVLAQISSKSTRRPVVGLRTPPFCPRFPQRVVHLTILTQCKNGAIGWGRTSRWRLSILTREWRSAKDSDNSWETKFSREWLKLAPDLASDWQLQAVARRGAPPRWKNRATGMVSLVQTLGVA